MLVRHTKLCQLCLQLLGAHSRLGQLRMHQVLLRTHLRTHIGPQPQHSRHLQLPARCLSVDALFHDDCQFRGADGQPANPCLQAGERSPMCLLSSACLVGGLSLFQLAALRTSILVQNLLSQLRKLYHNQIYSTILISSPTTGLSSG